MPKGVQVQILFRAPYCIYTLEYVFYKDDLWYCRGYLYFRGIRVPMAFPKKCFRRKSCGNKLKTENGELLSYTANRVAVVPATAARQADTAVTEF